MSKLLIQTEILLLFIYFLSQNVQSHPIVSADNDESKFHYNSSDLPFLTSWPLKAGFPGLKIENLDDYVSLFPHCLTVVHNHQGIEMAEWKNPLYLFRFDVALNTEDVWSPETRFNRFSQIQFEKLPPQNNVSEQALDSIERVEELMVHEAKLNCYAQFDLYFPEKSDAFHFYFPEYPIQIYSKYLSGKMCFNFTSMIVVDFHES